MKLLIILSLLFTTSLSYGQQTTFFDDMQSAIESLSDGEFVIVEYNKSGDWGAYEGGKLILNRLRDQIHMELTTRQNYLGAKNKVSHTVYKKDALLSTLQENKRSYSKDPDNIVFNNTFNYRILNGKNVLASGTSPLEPSEVVNAFKVNPALENIFFKGTNKVFKNNIKG